MVGEQSSYLEQLGDARGFERAELGGGAVFEHEKKHCQCIVGLHASERHSNTPATRVSLWQPQRQRCEARTTARGTSSPKSPASGDAEGCRLQTRTC
jgi:hypothetical protein